MNEESLFAAVLEQPRADRTRFLEEACGADAALLQRLRVLLAAHEKAVGILDQPAQPPGSPGDTAGYVPASEQVGTVIAGRYKLLEQIGEGGMGTVWVAEQTQPVRRKVALKLIKAGMDSRTVLSRFEAERQALALMDHPNIAKVLDGGTTDSGRPFFVMEYVKGVPFTRYCDDARLSIAERLALFVPVCQAVQHAHQKGIIHRDLKPSNILICLYDGQPVPKVIDFGLAKAMHQPLTEHTLYTAHGLMMGTPLYMSPEQAEFNNLDVDTRTDIYALGVILYELLTGTTPLENRRFKAAAWQEMLRLIKEEEPPRPSARLSGSGSLPSVAAQRRLEPEKLTRLVRGELDWIVMKCLEKDRGRRYETANGLARDLGRYLHDEPVEACPPSTSYRLQKFVRKHRAGLATAAAMTVLLLLGSTVSTWQAVRATRAEAEARMMAEDEKRARAETQAMLDFVEKQVFAAARPEGLEGGLGREVTLRRAIEAALPFLAQSFHDQPLIEARLRMALGTSFNYMEECKIAAGQFQKARAIYTEHRGPDHPDTLRSMSRLASCYNFLGQKTEAFKLIEETLALQKTKLSPDHDDTLESMSVLAYCYDASNRYVEALKLQEEVLVLRKAKHGSDHPDTLRSMHDVGRGYFALGRYAVVLKLDEERLALQKAKLGPDHPLTLWTKTMCASDYLVLGRYTEAVKLLEETLPLYKAKFGPDHHVATESSRTLAVCYQRLGRHADALKLYEETLELRKAKLGPDHPLTLIIMQHMASSYAVLGRHDETLKLHEQTLELRKAKLGPDHFDTLQSMNNVALSYTALGHYADALKLHGQTLELRKAKLGPDHRDTLWSMLSLANSYAALGRYDEALKLHEQTLELRKAKLGPDHADTLASMNSLAWMLATASDATFRDPPRALELAKKAAELSPKIASYWGTFGTVRYRTGDWKGAIADLEKAIGLRTPDRPGNAANGFFLAMAHWQLGAKDKAREWFAKAVQWMEKGNKENAQLKRFRAEAAELLGVEKKD
jgi:serine/threonine protein kinase/tetratricopeptide (TPR) repeat protein